MENIAFVYHYWNINNLMSYYGYKKDWNKKKYSLFDIFVTHPLGEKSTKNHYCGSITQDRWVKACENGEIYGEIIAVFTGKNAGILAHEYEHQMIISHKAKYGQETLYNRSDGYVKFSTLGYKASEGTRKKQSLAKKNKKLPDKTKKKMSIAHKGEKNGMFGKHFSEGAKQKQSISHLGLYQTEETRKKRSDSLINNQKLSKKIIQYTAQGEFIKEWPSLGEAERQLKIAGSNICRCCKGERNIAGGFIWRYKE